MLAITLDEIELTELKLLLRDIELIQKLNKPFDYSAINTLYYIIDSINKKEDYCSQTEISDEEIEKAGELIFENEGKNIYNHYNTVPSWVQGAKWYREQLKYKGNG